MWACGTVNHSNLKTRSLDGIKQVEGLPPPPGLLPGPVRSARPTDARATTAAPRSRPAGPPPASPACAGMPASLGCAQSGASLVASRGHRAAPARARARGRATPHRPQAPPGAFRSACPHLPPHLSSPLSSRHLAVNILPGPDSTPRLHPADRARARARARTSSRAGLLPQPLTYLRPSMRRSLVAKEDILGRAQHAPRP